MPFIDVKVVENVLTTEQKQEIARGITDVFVGVAGEPARAVTHVVIQDVASGEWMIAGNALTTEAVKEMLKSPARV